MIDYGSINLKSTNGRETGEVFSQRKLCQLVDSDGYLSNISQAQSKIARAISKVKVEVMFVSWLFET